LSVCWLAIKVAIIAQNPPPPRLIRSMLRTSLGRLSPLLRLLAVDVTVKTTQPRQYSATLARRDRY
jgi:hypothetical protein